MSDFESEGAFEKLLRKELSFLTSENLKQADLNPRFSLNPEDKKFCSSISGKALLVVGLHPNSSRKARQSVDCTIL